MKSQKELCLQKRYADGKCYFVTECDPEYEKMVEEALVIGIESVHASFNKKKFAQALKERGLPDNKIREYLDNLRIHDQIYLSQVWGH